MNLDVSISSLCFDYRDSILFWIFLFELNQTKVLRDFILQCPTLKLKKGISETIIEDYPKQLDLMIRENDIQATFFGGSFRKLLRVKESIQIRGQRKRVPVIIKENRLYPMGGTKRIVSLILLGCKEVKVVTEESQGIDDYSLTSSYFQNVPKNIMVKYKKWKPLFIKKDFYYEPKPTPKN